MSQAELAQPSSPTEPDWARPSSDKEGFEVSRDNC